MGRKKEEKDLPEIKTVDLSIDFDFFIREDPLWDFGHSEVEGPMGAFFLTTLWDVRYSTINLYEETDILKYADFRPQAIFTSLQRKGVWLSDKAHAGFAESHKEALPFFRGALNPPDVFINVDAHHDLYSDPEGRTANCGNWLTALYDQWSSHGTRFLQLYPRWKNMRNDGTPVRPIEMTTFKKWEGFKDAAYLIRNVFFCRSGAWVPPHHDDAYFATVSMIAQLARSYEERGQFMVRSAPSREECVSMVQKYTEQKAELLAKHQLEKEGSVEDG